MSENAPAWPNARAEGTKVYQFEDGHGETMVAMRKEAWLDYGTLMERFRRAATDLDKKIREKDAECAGLAAKCNDITARYNELAEKHQALREQLATRMREELKRTLILPEAKDFKPNR